MRLCLKIPALALSCYLGGLWFFQREHEETIEPEKSTRDLTRRVKSPHHPLRQKGAVQIESTLAFVSQLDSSNACRAFASQLNLDPKSRHSRSLWSVILARWSQLDPEGMLTFLEDEEESGRATHMESLAWQAWGASDPRGAFVQLHRIGGDLPKELFKGIAHVDPDLAIDLAFQVPDAGGMVEVVLESGARFTNETLDKLRELANVSQITWDLNRVLQRHGTTGDPAHDLKIFRSHLNYLGMSAPFFEELTKKAPLDAVALLEQDPSSQDRASSMVEVAKNWALSDPEASVAWARQQTSPQIRINSLVAIASVIGGKDPLLGLSLIEEVAWEDTQVLWRIQPVKEGKVQQGSTVFENNNKTLNVASSIFQSLATSDPAAARLYLSEKVPLEHRLRFQYLIKP